MKKKSKKYSNTKLILNIFVFFLEIALLFIAYFSGFTHFLSYKFSFLFYILIFDITLKIILAPISFYSGYILEHKYDLSNQTIFVFLKQKLKADILSIIVFVFFMFVIYFLFDRYTNTWWFVVWIVWNVFNVFVAFVFPNLILPIFYKLKKLDNNDLIEAVLDLCNKTGFNQYSAEKIYSINLGKDTVKANAAVIGFGKTRKIVLADTLLANFTIPEIMSVLAHEIGHAKKKHIIKIMLSSVLGSFVILWISKVLLLLFLSNLGVISLSDPAAMPLVLLYFIVIFFVLAPFNNFISRKMEVEADEFACKNYSSEHFITAMQRLSDLNLADESPHPLVEVLFYSHPSIKRRIDFAKLIK